MEGKDYRLLVADDRTMLVDGIEAAVSRTLGAAAATIRVDAATAVTADPGGRAVAVVGTVAAADEVVATLIVRRIPVVVVAARLDPAQVTSRLQHGVMGYVSETESLTHLVQAVDNALAGTGYLSPAVERALAGPVRTPPALSARELEITGMYIAAEAPSARQIAHALGISVDTVNAHLTRIRARLAAAGFDAGNRIALRTTLHAHGYHVPGR